MGWPEVADFWGSSGPPKIGDFRPAQKPCIKNPSVKDFGALLAQFLISLRRFWGIFQAGVVPGAPGARRGPQGAKHRVVFWPWYPKPPKKHLAQKPLLDPFELGRMLTPQMCRRAPGPLRRKGPTPRPGNLRFVLIYSFTNMLYVTQ